jgi:hypothetical protein
MNDKNRSGISRREFARRAAIVSAVSFVPSSELHLSSEAAPPLPHQQVDVPPLSPESQAEAEARYQAILATYGSRFNDAQKTELRRLSFSAQPSLDRVRAYNIQNSDASALYLKPLVEREKKGETAAPPRTTVQTPTKS